MVGFMKSALNLFGLNKKEGAATGGGVDLEQFLTELPQLMGYDVSFKRSEKSEPGLHFEVEGSEADSFLGESCEMLDALAHVSMRVLRRNEGVSNAPAAESSAEAFRVTFDAAGGFRDKKAQELKELATSQRLKVIESGGKPAYIRALGPSERKIIHTTLVDLGEVTSESIGRGNFKRIRIKLKDDSPLRRDPPPRSASADGNGGGQREPGNGGGGQRRGGQGGGQGGGRGRGGQGGGGRGRFNNENRGPRGPNRGGNESEINGNLAPNLDLYDSHPDDNIGNRLKPGEQPAFFQTPARYDDNGNN